jgi:DMSO reductase anchor subunit
LHPAFSVIFLTTLIGVGQGLFLALFTGQLYSLARLVPLQDSTTFYAFGSLLALVFLGLGLTASFFHLGRPERAWRSATRWRTSWLSREVVVLPAVMGLVALYGLAHWFGFTQPLLTISGVLPVDPTLVIGSMATVATFLLFVCTGMIYASIRFIREWATPLTIFNFILMGGASGFVLATLFSYWVAPSLVAFFGGWAMVLTLLALISRASSLWRNARLKCRATIQTAIGVRHPKIVQTATGGMGGSFNTREFRHGATAEQVRQARWSFLLLVLAVPLLLLTLALVAQLLPLAMLLLAFLAQLAGLLVERWSFFADARHPQNLYYQSI